MRQSCWREIHALGNRFACASMLASANSAIGPELSPRPVVTTWLRSNQRGYWSAPAPGIWTQPSFFGQSDGCSRGPSAHTFDGPDSKTDVSVGSDQARAASTSWTE